MSTELAKTYQPAAVEPEIHTRWLQSGAFHADAASPGVPYAIVIPPPNVTAPLHMGHALNNTLQDILVRWRRMQGRNAMWMPGTDHAGIATQTVVEKRVLQEEGKRRTDFDRDVFVAKIQAWKDEYEARITEQLRAMGCSCDWERQRFTMDPVCAAAVREAFFRLFSEGLIYRGKRLVNWDPVTQTALADDEVEMQEVDGSFWYLRYPLTEPVQCDGETIDSIVVATTRPETMLGDTAVAMNPNDPRAPALRGAQVRLPIVDRIIPIVEDDYVILPDPDGDEKARFSSGFLKVTPAHDPNDWEIGLRFGLDVINVMAPDASVSRDYGWPEAEFASGAAREAEQFLGLSREEARAGIVEWFKTNGLLDSVKPYRHAVGHSYRSHVPIEPYLSDQWYVKVTDERLAGAALRAMNPEQRTASEGCVWRRDDDPPEGATARGKAETEWHGALKFYPPRYAKIFQAWHENIRDWCISRQLWWGHRIPVWSADAGAQFDITPYGDRLALQVIGERHYICVRRPDQELEEALAAAGFVQDDDVLDTWFSSALWPISTLGWPKPEDFPDSFQSDPRPLDTWNPSDTLCTAREIITLWVSRMVMFNLFFRDRLPFRDVFIHAMIQDGEGQKMSKSLGNGVDPLDIIHHHGSDAMRFTLASMTTNTQDVRMPVDIVCPHTGETFTPRMVTTSAGHRVAAPLQECPSDPSKQMVTSYGIVSGEARSATDTPQARNTSSKFEFGRNFANKLWNAVRFSLGHLTDSCGAANGQPDLASRWLLSRLAGVIGESTRALESYEFGAYAQQLYSFTWRDFCDWYIEAIKPTVQDDLVQQRVLASAIDAILRLLHPSMPFVTEKLWESLSARVAERGVEGLALPAGDLLIRAPWPSVDATLVDAAAEEAFALVQSVVTAVREVRTTHKVAPRERIVLTARASAPLAARLSEHAPLIATLATVEFGSIGPEVTQPDRAGSTAVGEIELYLHDLVDVDAERERLARRLQDVGGRVKSLTGRLANENYVSKAPSHLVEETRQQLVDAEREAEALKAQLAELG